LLIFCYGAVSPDAQMTCEWLLSIRKLASMNRYFARHHPIFCSLMTECLYMIDLYKGYL